MPESEIARQFIGRIYWLGFNRLRQDKKCAKILALLQDAEDLSVQEIQDYQFLQTKRVIEEAFRNTVWYPRKFAEYGVGPSDFKCLEDIRRFPLLTKADLRDNLSALTCSSLLSSDAEYITTGGSTGLPVGFYQSKALQSIERAFFEYQWGKCGVKPGDRCVVFRGAFVGTSADPIKYFPSSNEWHCSIYCLSDESIAKYINLIQKVRPRFIQAYPSAIAMVARYIEERDIAPPCRLRAIMCGSENLFEDQRRLIERTFDAPVHAWYGQAEKVCMAVWDRARDDFAALPHYGLTEMLGADGNDIGESELRGEIVATSFWNDLTPLIRYRTSDMAVGGGFHKSNLYPYARRFRKIEGRAQEFLVTKSGRLISMTAINMHDDIFDLVVAFRFFQSEKGKAVLQVVPKAGFSSDVASLIQSRLAVKLGTECDLEIEPVRELPRTRSGKFHFLDQRIPIRHWDGSTEAGDSCVGS
jgi:phenylacetate-CoA ligase